MAIHVSKDEKDGVNALYIRHGNHPLSAMKKDIDEVAYIYFPVEIMQELIATLKMYLDGDDSRKIPKGSDLRMFYTCDIKLRHDFKLPK